MAYRLQVCWKIDDRDVAILPPQPRENTDLPWASNCIPSPPCTARKGLLVAGRMYHRRRCICLPCLRLPNLTDLPSLTPDRIDALLAAARAARGHAHAPYSHFAVGAALLDEQGRIHAGCNIENAAYPQGLCAEAVAIGHLVLAGGQRIVAAAVVGEGAGLVTPCGGCRQKLREFAGNEAPVLVADMTQLRARFTLGELLPASFGPEHLA